MANATIPVIQINEGNVGIGTTSPANKLVVSVSTAGDYAALINNTNSTNGYGLLARTASTGTSSYAFAARAGSSDIFVVRADGNVGIGTTNPTTRLTISGVQELLQLTRGGSSDSKWFFATDSAKLYIGEGTSYGTGIKMTLTDAGNVGIGTALPDSKLDVTGGDITINTAATGFMNFKYGSAGSEVSRGTITTDGIDLKINSVADLLLLPSGTNKVGVGTTNPSYKFHVSGTSIVQAITSSAADVSMVFINTTSTNYMEFFNGEYNLYQAGGSASNVTLKITNAGAVRFPKYSGTLQTGTPTYLLGTDASGNIVKTLSTPGGDPGPYLPLTGGTLTSTTSPILILNPTANNYGGIQFNYGGAVKGAAMYNSGFMVFGGEAGTHTRLQAGGQYAMHINSSTRNVHIGSTTDSTYKLAVNGTFYGGGNATFADYVGIGVTASTNAMLDVKGPNTDNAVLGRFYSNTGARGSFIIRNGSGTNPTTFIGTAGGSEQLSIGTNDTEAIRLDASQNAAFTGNVTVRSGLGAVDTDGVLTINGGSGTNGEAYLNLSRGGTSGFILNHAAGNIQIRGTANIPMYFWTNNVIRQTIAADGKVGIGTTSLAADSILTIGTTASTGLTLLSVSNAGESFINFADTADVNAGRIYYGHSDNAMRFRTNDGLRMIIDSSGNVGIGTTTPQSKLQIQANQHAANPGGKNYTGSAINADGGDIATGKLFLQGYQKTANDLCGFNNEADRVVLYNYTDARYLQIWNHTGDTFIPNGNVGIGTTSPDGNLEVVGTTVISTVTDGVNAVLIGLAGSNRTTIQFDTADTTHTNRQWGLTNIAGDFYIGRHGLNVMKMNNNGNVGIGLTNPAVPLDVEGKIRSNDNSSGDYLEIFCDGSVSGDSYIENTNNNIQIKSAFATSFSTSGSVAMFIKNNQNVGIGTTNPGAKLEVAGVIFAADGNKAAPSYSFTSDPDTGMMSDAANHLKFVTGADIRMVITSTGALAFGSSTNYGTSGQVLTSNGNAAPSWQSGGGGASSLNGLSDCLVNNTNSSFNIGNNASGMTGIRNTTIGASAGTSITSGTTNICIGPDAGNSIANGSQNIAIGYLAQGGNVFNTGNISIGYLSQQGSNGGNNVSIGNYSLRGTQNTGNRNGIVAIGYQAAQSLGNLSSNCIVIGFTAQASATTTSNEITLGNSSITSLRCAVTSITSLSDERDKSEIKDLEYGLDFIDSLKPREFVWDNRVETKTEIDNEGNETEVEFYSANKGKKDFGFIAQEVKELDNDTLRLVYDNNPEKLELSYGKLVPVLVKAIQELKAEIELLKQK